MRNRYNCIECGKGFNARGWEITKYCKQSCMKKAKGSAWKSGMFIKREKSMSYEEKLKFAENL